MTATVRVAVAVLGIATGVLTTASLNTSAAPTTPAIAWATNTNPAQIPDIRLAGFDQVLADDACDGGALQGSYYCSQQSGTQSQTTQDTPDTYTPAQPPFGYNNLPQCSGSSSAIAGALSGDGCS
jgi:hypothetical protein